VPEAKLQTACVTAESSSAPIEISKLTDENIYGLKGMCGNAAEWTSSWLVPYRGNTARDSRFGKRFKVIRGGSYEHPLELAKSYVRLAGGIPSLSADKRAGFRCARSE
jgi:formylglycine-generating enzyme required for sulfatase activity